MGLMDRIKKVTGTNDAYDEAYDDDYYGGFDGYNDGEDDSDMQMAGGMNPPMGGMAAPMQNSAPVMGGGLSLSGNNIKMQVVRPQSFDSVSQIADHLLNKCTVVLNLENTNKETSRRLIDFLSGVAYSIDGSIKRIANQAYVITPSNVDVGDAQLKNRQKPVREEEPASEPAEDEFGDFN
ncbi:MAG: cell division protein SepF [Ruminococcaceae bacterium]|nr:cell division protein SepF [Oscillospiraceae bacterium]